MPGMHVLDGPATAKWQPVPSDAPIAVQVAEFVSEQLDAARRHDTRHQHDSRHRWKKASSAWQGCNCTGILFSRNLIKTIHNGWDLCL